MSAPSALLALVGGVHDLGRQALEVAREGVAALRRLADAAERIADRGDEAEADGPVMGRLPVSEAIGISPSSFDEVLKTCPPDLMPPSMGKQRRRVWFESPEAARRWFAEVQAANNTPSRRGTAKRPARRMTPAKPAPAIDLRRVAREAIAARGDKQGT